MVTCKQHTKMNKCNYNRVFQATKFLAITNSGSWCSVRCLLPCIYKLCDGFLAAVNKARDLAKASKRVAKIPFFGKFYLIWSKECVKTTTML